MEKFSELERDFGRRAVQMIEDGVVKASGYLALARENTEVVLSSPVQIGHSRNEKGWFDLRLRAGTSAILLEKALSVHSTSFVSHEDTSQWAIEEKIFPNIIIFNIPNIDAEYKVKSVSFALSGFKYFFYYQYFEWIGLSGAKKNSIKNLKNLRSKNSARDFFQPSDLYVAHHPPEHLIKFKIAKRTYSVWARYRKTAPGWDELRVDAEPIASINFDEPVSTDDALDYVWQWRRFFSQLAMQPLNIEGISFRSADQSIFSEASVYLPNIAVESLDLHPGDLPLNRWKDHEGLQASMKMWLSKDDDRRLFRIAIDRVIDRSRKRISLDDILTICAGIESASDFSEEISISTHQISAIADAARKAAQDNGVDINRLRGVLDLLRHQSLPRRLTLLGRTLESIFNKANIDSTFKAVLELRTIAAHGKSIEEISMPKMAPAIETLLGLCVAYDLTTCGIPSQANDGLAILALRQARRSIIGLKHLNVT